MKKTRLSRDQLRLAIVLIIPGAVVPLVWMIQLGHAPPGLSRVDWPPPPTVKP